MRGEQLFACRRVRLAARGEVGLALKRLKRGASEWVEPPVVGALVTEVAQPLLDAAHSRDSWYVRPLFLIPACYFAYQRSWTGVFGTVFLLLTSMFWFPEPAVVDERVREFLEREKQYLRTPWTLEKVLFTLLVPISLGALFGAFWKRSFRMGLFVLVAIALAKMLWSVAYGGEAGTSIFAPALVGLLLSGAVLYLAAKHWNRRK